MSALPAYLLVVLALLVFACYAPGLLVVNRLRWRDRPWRGLEKLCAATALSLIFLWLAVWSIYVFLPPSATAAASRVLAGVIAVCAAVTARDALRLAAHPRVRRALLAFALLLGWTVLALCIIRVYSGAGWGGDWIEHFQRSLFFVHHFPAGTPIYREYVLPARPPMMNVLAAFFMAVTQDRFEIFQLVFAFLNLLVFLPCCLALPLMARVRRPTLVPLTVLFALNPAFMENATYPWTKLLSAFFVIFALTLYLGAFRRHDPVRMTAAFVSLAAGLMVHYSAGPYVVFFALHYLLFGMRDRPARVKELSGIVVASAALLFTWFGWSIATYGLKPTLASNTSVTSARQIGGSNLEKIALNTLDSIVPRVFYQPSATQPFVQPYAPAFVRDIIFLFYNANLIFSMGVIGGPIVVWTLIAAFRGRARPRRAATGERSFWLMLIGFSVAIGLAVVGERDTFGVAHLTLISLELLGITLLSARFFTSRTIAWVIVAGCALDFGAGVFLQERIQHLENSPTHTYYTGLAFDRGQFLIGAPGPESLSAPAWRSWMGKGEIRLANEWLAAGMAFRAGDPSVDPARAELHTAIADVVKDDDTYWHGWYRRNGGEIHMLGDFFPGDMPLALFAAAAALLLFQMARRAQQVSPASAATTPAARARSARKR